MRAFLRWATALALAAIAFSVHGQVTFERPVRIIVTAAPGGLTDTLARGLAQRLTPVWGQPVIVENRPGANNIIGAELVAKSAPDGYTFLVTEASTFVINPFLHKKLPYDAVQDFTPITGIGATANVIAVPTALGVNSLPEFVAKAREKPGGLSFGSTGMGSYAHIASEQLSRLTGIQLTHVPYKGSAPLHLDLIAGNVSMYIGHISGAMMQQRETGKLRFLASATRNRLPQFPDMPTASEAGAPGFEANVVWNSRAREAASGDPEQGPCGHSRGDQVAGISAEIHCAQQPANAGAPDACRVPRLHCRRRSSLEASHRVIRREGGVTRRATW